jgi:hypothetical protein
VNIPDEHVPMIIRALEHYADFLKATSRDDRLPRDLAESFKKKPPAKQEPGRAVRRKKA